MSSFFQLPSVFMFLTNPLNFPYEYSNNDSSLTRICIIFYYCKIMAYAFVFIM